MKCELCRIDMKTHKRFCCNRCKTIARLRARATKQLMEAEEQMFGRGYDSVVKRAWVKSKLDEISQGLQDEEMYLMFLRRSG